MKKSSKTGKQQQQQFGFIKPRPGTAPVRPNLPPIKSGLNIPQKKATILISYPWPVVNGLPTFVSDYQSKIGRPIKERDRDIRLGMRQMDMEGGKRVRN